MTDTLTTREATAEADRVAILDHHAPLWLDDEAPTCSICDGLGHGYPGGAPCPLEERGEQGVPAWAQ